MLKHLLIKIEFYDQTFTGLVVSLFILLFASILGIEKTFLYITCFLSIGLAYFSLTKYVKERDLWKSSIRYKDFNSCRDLIGTECQVGQINKFLDIYDKSVYYDVYFKYQKIKNGQKVTEVGCIKVSLNDNPEILLSLFFTFTLKNTGVEVKSLDKEKYQRTHTRVMVFCFNGAQLHLKSKNGFDYIHQAVKHPDLLFPE